ncbi:metallophosphoesterase [Mucilaginibacter corticis]|uniref:Metallophosphoesterase n=1 Tax=Mucilaginibacter corticis TaxID=2597670 RepID=A0A556MM26_9SPHI|nr:metallophosphoesterase [Mucilaginibacter corticis]TSJ40960.1 metallophosphoesterase [Mucilaginibacter corticis]
MKHIVIGDLHGRDSWKQINFSKYDGAVFLGDYVDSFKRSDQMIPNNLRAIIALKKLYPQKIILLLGNHDVQYLHYPKYHCPGFRLSMQPALSALFQDNRHLFQIAYQRRNFLFTHAGITNRWFYNFRRSFAYSLLYRTGDTIADTLNRFETQTENSTIYSYSRYRTGHDSDGGPLWADYLETFHDSLNGYHQFVGHNPQDQPKQLCRKGKSITYLDVLHKQAYFHEIHC